ncbi:hypothetical protein ACVIW0_001473 [Bradyrhizobium sp. USDA 4454]
MRLYYRLDQGIRMLGSSAVDKLTIVRSPPMSGSKLLFVRGENSALSRSCSNISIPIRSIGSRLLLRPDHSGRNIQSRPP